MAPAPQPKAGMAMVRAIHASANAPQVDVYVKGNPTPVVTGLSYGQTSGWLEVPQGSYTFELRAAPSKAYRERHRSIVLRPQHLPRRQLGIP